MDWWHALILGLVQGLTEFLPVSSSGHLMIFRELLGADPEGFLDFTVAVHFATVLSTLVVFRKVIAELFRGLFRFRYNDQTDYVCKILVSMIPVGVVGLFFRDSISGIFSDDAGVVPWFLLLTALLLFLSDFLSLRVRKTEPRRNGISYGQAFLVGVGQALAVFPGLSRSGTTIATGLMSGVKRDKMAQFSFLMVLIPIIGEQCLDLIKTIGSDAPAAAGVGTPALLIGAVAAFVSGLFACKVMIGLVRRSKMSWFAVYCLVVAVLMFVFA